MIIANFYFYNENPLFQYLDKGVKSLFEDFLGLDSSVDNEFFVLKIVPNLVMCGASIITTETVGVSSYEIKVESLSNFMRRFESVVKEVN